MNVQVDYLEILQERVWEHPSDYGGFSPDGDYVILGQCRDSSALERSNYESAFNHLAEVAGKFNGPRDKDRDRFAWVYDFRASHWAVGWCETLLVRADAPEEVLIAAAEIISSLSDYPVLDEEDFSAKEYEEVEDAWKFLSLRERLRTIREVNERGARWGHYTPISMFAARRDDAFAHHNDLYDHLRPE